MVVVAALVLVEPARPTPRDRPRPDLPGAVLLTACPLLFVYAAIEAGGSGTVLWLSLVSLLGAAAAAAAFVRVEARSPAPLVPPAFFAHRDRVRANLTTMLLSGALSTSFLLFTFYLQDRRGIGPLAAGLTMLPLAAALILASVAVPRLLGRWGARRCVLAGLGAAAAAMAAVALVAVLDGGAGWLVPAMLLIAAGMGLGLVGLQYVAVSGTTDRDAGIAAGVQRAADQLGGAGGVAVYVGLGFAPTPWGGNPFLITALLAVAGLAVGAVIIGRSPVATAERSAIR